LRRLGKLYNGDGEIIAEGPCELNEEGSQVSMWPTLERGLFERERGVMTLELEGGASLPISERRLKLRISPSQGPRTAIYRMHVDGVPAAQAEPPASEAPEGVPAHARRADLSGGLSTAP
jgi:hypothetical protein